VTVISAVPPGLVLILGAFLLPLVGPRQRTALVLGLPLLVLAMVWQVPDGVSLGVPFLGYELEVVKGDRLTRMSHQGSEFWIDLAKQVGRSAAEA